MAGPWRGATSKLSSVASSVGDYVITCIRNATNEEWDNIVDSVESAIYFQTREWFDIWAGYAGFESDTRLIHLDSGRKALLPLAHITLLKGLVKVYFLAPKGMGGFLTNDEFDDGEKRELFGTFKKYGMIYCAVNPYDKLTNQFDGFTAEEFTQVLDLREGFESIFKKWTIGHSSAVKKGIREGITVELASTEDDWKAFFKVYLAFLARQYKNATNIYRWELFEIMFKKKSPHIKLWLAKYRGQVISGALNFYHNKHVAGWYGATLQEFYKLNAFHVLQYYIIQDACEKGFLVYDFMPSNGREGVIHFKNGFSPQKKPVRIYMSPLMKTADAMRKKVRNSAAYKFLMKNTGF
jgi:lipid II:glycine glycyltransferase (peptidoglycan interpeptide bridge formation enzyme)